MAKVRNLGLFPKAVRCPQREEGILQNGFGADIFIAPNANQPPFLFACAHFWRVKTWRISLFATWAEFDSSIAQFTDSFVDTISQGIQRFDRRNEGEFIAEDSTLTGEELFSELQILCNQPSVGHSFTRLNSVLSSSGGSGTDIALSYNCFLGPSSSIVPAFFRLDDQGNVASAATGFVFSVETLRWDIRATAFEGNTGSYGIFTYSLLGQVFEVPLFARNFLVGNDNSLSISASLEAIEYYAYDPGDGDGPIYDSVTGEQLRSFPE